MEVQGFIQKGYGHPVFCEDFIYHKKINDDWLVACVMDGCSSGTDSHFASALIGKIVSKTVLTLPMLYKIHPELDLNNITESALGQYFAEQLFSNLKKVSSYLMLDYKEALSTILISIYNRTTKRAWLMISGDGYYAINGKVTEVYQDNRPDYVTYHLNHDFEKWYKNHVKVVEEENVHELALSTDGIGSFFNPRNGGRSFSKVTDELLIEKIDSPQFLRKKVQSLYQMHNLVPYDDLGIVRVVDE